MPEPGKESSPDRVVLIEIAGVFIPSDGFSPFEAPNVDRAVFDLLAVLEPTAGGEDGGVEIAREDVMHFRLEAASGQFHELAGESGSECRLVVFPGELAFSGDLKSDLVGADGKNRVQVALGKVLVEFLEQCGVRVFHERGIIKDPGICHSGFKLPGETS